MAQPPDCCNVAALREVQLEHSALLRQWAALQTRMTALIDQHTRTCDHLHAQLMRARAQLVVQRSAWLWALHPPQPVKRVMATSPSPAMSTMQRSPPPDAATHDVLCDTGCTGHAHAWYDTDTGHCTRVLSPCTRVHVPPEA